MPAARAPRSTASHPADGPVPDDLVAHGVRARAVLRSQVATDGLRSDCAALSMVGSRHGKGHVADLIISIAARIGDGAVPPSSVMLAELHAVADTKEAFLDHCRKARDHRDPPTWAPWSSAAKRLADVHADAVRAACRRSTMSDGDIKAAIANDDIRRTEAWSDRGTGYSYPQINIRQDIRAIRALSALWHDPAGIDAARDLARRGPASMDRLIGGLCLSATADACAANADVLSVFPIDRSKPMRPHAHAGDIAIPAWTLPENGTMHGDTLMLRMAGCGDPSLRTTVISGCMDGLACDRQLIRRSAWTTLQRIGGCPADIAAISAKRIQNAGASGGLLRYLASGKDHAVDRDLKHLTVAVGDVEALRDYLGRLVADRADDPDIMRVLARIAALDAM